jgi:hypothetical protein
MSILDGPVRQHAGGTWPLRTDREESAMKYMLLIYGPKDAPPASDEVMKQELDEYWAYDKATTEAGVLLGGNALQGLETASAIRQ